MKANNKVATEAKPRSRYTELKRMLEERRRRPDVQIVDLATRTTRTSYGADRTLLFAPQADLAIANAICHEIVRNDWVDHAFVEDHVAFAQLGLLRREAVA